MSIRDEFPAIRYRRKQDWSLESQRFNTSAEFESAGGKAAGWARSPKEVTREPVKPPAPAKVAPAAVVDPPPATAPPAPKRTRKPRSAAASKA